LAVTLEQNIFVNINADQLNAYSFMFED